MSYKSELLVFWVVSGKMVQLTCYGSSEANVVGMAIGTIRPLKDKRIDPLIRKIIRVSGQGDWFNLPDSRLQINLPDLFKGCLTSNVLRTVVPSENVYFAMNNEVPIRVVEVSAILNARDEILKEFPNLRVVSREERLLKERERRMEREIEEGKVRQASKTSAPKGNERRKNDKMNRDEYIIASVVHILNKFKNEEILNAASSTRIERNRTASARSSLHTPVQSARAAIELDDSVDYDTKDVEKDDISDDGDDIEDENAPAADYPTREEEIQKLLDKINETQICNNATASSLATLMDGSLSVANVFDVPATPDERQKYAQSKLGSYLNASGKDNLGAIPKVKISKSKRAGHSSSARGHE